MFRLQRFFQRRDPFLLVLRQTDQQNVCPFVTYQNYGKFNDSIFEFGHDLTGKRFFVIFVPECTTPRIKERNDDGINSSVTVSLHAQRFSQEGFPSCSLSRGYILSLLGLLNRTGHGTCCLSNVWVRWGSRSAVREFRPVEGIRAGEQHRDLSRSSRASEPQPSVFYFTHNIRTVDCRNK